MNETVTIEVFYTPTCPQCPAQKDLAKSFEADDVDVILTDATTKTRRAEKHGIQSVPTTIISGPGMEHNAGFRGITASERLQTAVNVARGEQPMDDLEKPGLLEHLKQILFD
jgi:glutaredoxin